MKPLLSIIIPFYNADMVIDNCLNSLEKQTSSNFEVIFVDDASNSKNLKILKDKLKKVTFSYQIVENRINSGPGVTRNNGILNANSPYIPFIDSDDYVDFCFVEKVENIINSKTVDIIM